MREAPALTIISELVAAGASVLAYDPVAMQVARPLLPGRRYLTDNALTATAGADGLLLVTEWPEFRLPDWQQVKKNMKQWCLTDVIFTIRKRCSNWALYMKPSDDDPVTKQTMNKEHDIRPWGLLGIGRYRYFIR